MANETVKEIVRLLQEILDDYQFFCFDTFIIPSLTNEERLCAYQPIFKIANNRLEFTGDIGDEAVDALLRRFNYHVQKLEESDYQIYWEEHKWPDNSITFESTRMDSIFDIAEKISRCCESEALTAVEDVDGIKRDEMFHSSISINFDYGISEHGNVVSPELELKYETINDLIRQIKPKQRSIAKPSETSLLSQTQEIPKIPWIASGVDFAQLIIALHDKGYIKADNPTEALRIAAPHFEGVNRNPHTLWQNAKNRESMKGLRIELPEPSRPKKRKTNL